MLFSYTTYDYENRSGHSHQGRWILKRRDEKSLDSIQNHVSIVKIIYGKNVSRQRNIGVKEIADSVDVIALLDDDVSFEPETFMDLVSMAYESSMIVHSDASWFFRPGGLREGWRL
ncbi:MAG: hypothetical protein QXF74_04800 [Nitrososphaerota archaeon]